MNAHTVHTVRRSERPDTPYHTAPLIRGRSVCYAAIEGDEKTALPELEAEHLELTASFYAGLPRDARLEIHRDAKALASRYGFTLDEAEPVAILRHRQRALARRLEAHREGGQP